MPHDFVHLHVRTEFSLVDSILNIKLLMEQLPKRGMRAVAITDYGNLFAVVKVYQTAISAGIKPILGCELSYCDLDRPNSSYSVVLLCQHEQGYRNLTKLISKAYQEGQAQGKLLIPYDWISAHAQGLIVLSGGRQGDIGQALLAQDEALAYQCAKKWLDVFGDRFYLEIQRTNRADETAYNERVVRLADALSIPIVATNDVRFLNEEDYDAHEARVCIHDGTILADDKRPQRYSVKQYLRSAKEMHLLFQDLPQALQNTVEISKRCTVMLTLGQHFLPNFPTPPNFTVEDYLSHLAREGLEKRLAQLLHAGAYPSRDRQGAELSLANARSSDLDPKTAQEIQTLRQPYDSRLDIELQVINSMGFAGYFLIVADFIQWAKAQGIPVGPGRGSGAGSLVAYALLITDLDPLQYDLLFERFLNPERVSMPDFDIDFCMEGRDRVIDYVAEKYGRQSVSQIITFGTMAAKAVVRDVGRVLGHPYGFVDKIAKLIPFELGITLGDALKREEELARRYREEEEVKELLDLGLKLEGITRNAGKHAGGVVIAPSELSDFTAIYCEAGSTQLVSQFDKDDVEAAGLVKFDFLGLRTLTIIDWALKIINQDRDEKVDIATIPLDDQTTFQLLLSCQTTGVFQLESRGMKDLIHRLKPDCFEDVIALVALFRPGPLQSGMVDDFIARKHGLASVEYLHPDLEPILKPTYGVILYQEQVMQIAQVLANYTLGAADLLRRAMGKKKAEEMANQRAIFTAGAHQKGIALEVATTIFDLMEKFAGYGFNKSHSAAYALIAYQTAWLKARYTAAFMAALLSADMDNTDKVVIFIQDCARLKLTVLPPSLNHSQYKFMVVDERTIRYGLGAIKGVGESAIDHLIHERNQDGPYQSLFDMCQRIDLRKVNRRVFDALIKSGSMDAWGVERSVLANSLEKSMQVGIKHHQNKDSGQIDLFALFDEPIHVETYIDCKPWSLKERLEGEKETLGYYLTGHPSEPYLQEFKSFIQCMATLNPLKHKRVMTAGLITNIKRIITKNGKKMMIIHLENAKASLDAVAFSEVFESLIDKLVVGSMLIVEGDLGQDDYTGGYRMLANALYSVEEARLRFAKCLTISLSQVDQSMLPALKSLLNTYQGKCVVQICYSHESVSATMSLGLDFCVKPVDELIFQLTDLLGDCRVELRY